jgi:hypothetical protein
MDYKRTTLYRIGLAFTAVGIFTTVVYLVQKHLADVGLGAFEFLIQPPMPIFFLAIGFFLTTIARRRAAKEEAEDQEES